MLTESLRDRFNARHEPEPMSGCWLWTGITSLIGYGYFPAARSIHGCPELMAHRIAWHLHRGPVPDGMKVLHHCDVRSCVNPTHLFLGTQADNVLDMMNKGRHRAVPLFGVQNPMAKLTSEIVHLMRQEHAAGITQHALAKKYGVAVMTVNRAVRRISWGRA